MSVEKLDFNKVTQSHIPYHLVLRDVVQNIKCPIALSIWVYLGSLPPDWNINKQHLKNHFGLGDKALKKAFSLLSSYKLIQYKQDKDETGMYKTVTIHVLGGFGYLDMICDEDGNIDTAGSKTAPPDSTAGSKTARAVYGTCRKEGTTKEIIKTNKIKEKKKNTDSVFKNKKSNTYSDSVVKKECFHPSHKDYIPIDKYREENPSQLVMDYLNKKTSNEQMKVIPNLAYSSIRSVCEILRH